jgi:hypothetical protein
MPSAWQNFVPTQWDVMLFIGTLGLFLTLLFLFLRVLPAISIFEMRELVHKESHHQPAEKAGARAYGTAAAALENPQADKG